MKKIISTVLALSLTAALCPHIAFADGTAENAAEKQETQTVYELTQEEIDSGRFDMDKSLNKQLKRELAKNKNNADDEEERYFRQKEYLNDFLHADEQGVEPPELTDDSAELMAEQMTVKGTISLPAGVSASADGRIGVYLVNIDKEGSRVYSVSSYTEYYQILNAKKGVSSVNYTITAPKDKYALAVCYIDGDGIVLNDTEYYTSKGNTCYAEVADVISGSKTVNMTLSRAERTISGTVTLPKPAEEDGDICLILESLDTDQRYEYDNTEFVYAVKKGQTEVDYKLGAKSGVYSLMIDYYCGNSYMDGYLTVGYNTDGSTYRTLNLDAQNKSIDNLDFAVTDNSEENGENPEEQLEEVTLKINFEKPFEEDCRLSAGLVSYSSGRYVYTEVKAGATSADIKLKVRKNEGSIIRIRNYDHGTDYYIGEGSELVLDENDASFISSDAGVINVTYPEEYKITGTVSRNGAYEGEGLEADIIAETGEYRTYSYVYFNRNDDEYKYEIYMPSCLAGSSASISVDGYYYPYVSCEEKEFVVSENVTDLDLELVQDASCAKVNGTINIPNGAPNGGIVVSVEGAVYAVPKGTKSFEYIAYVRIRDDDYSTLTVRAACDDKRLLCCDEWGDHVQYITVDPYEERNDYTLRYFDTQITGKIKLPENITLDNAVSYDVCAEVYGDGDDYYEYVTYGSLLKGETEKEYTIPVSSEYTLSDLYVHVWSVDDAVSEQTVHYDMDNELSLKNGLKDADFVLEGTNKSIKGNIIVPSDFTGTAYASVCTGATDDETELITITANDAGKSVPYSIQLSENKTETKVYISFSSESDCNYYTGATYYSENGSVYNSSDASYVTIGDNGADNVNIELIPAVNLRGTVSFEEGSYINDERASLYSVVPDISTGSESYGPSGGWSHGGGSSSGGSSGKSIRLYVEGVVSKSFYFINPSVDRANEFSISVPAGAADGLIMYAYVNIGNRYSTNICDDGRYYYTGSNMLAYGGRAEAQPVNAGSGSLDLVIPHGYSMSGKINTPADMTGGIEKISISARNSNGNRVSLLNEQLHDGNTYTALMPPLKGDYEISASFDLSNDSNIINKTYYHNSSTPVSISGDMENVDFTLEKGIRFYGDILLPDGVTAPEDMAIDVALLDYDTGDVLDNIYTDDLKYNFVFPEEEEYNVKISYMVSGGNRELYNGNLYYAKNVTVNSDYAASVPIGGADKKRDLPLVKNKAVIPVKATRAGYIPNEYDIDVNVIAKLDNGMTFNCVQYIDSKNDSSDISKLICIPDISDIEDATGFKLYYMAGFENENDYIRPDKTTYINADGSYTNDEQKATLYPLKDTKQIKFVVGDASETVAENVASGLISDINVSQSYMESDGAVVYLSSINKTGGRSNAYALVAAYDENNQLMNTGVAMVGIPDSDDGSAVYTNAFVPMETNPSYTYKLFLWDNVSKMNPLINGSVELAWQ